MFDTHCHLNNDAFCDSLPQFVEDARSVGVTHFLIPGTSFVSSKRAVKITEDFQNVYAAVGIHPTENLQSLSIEEHMVKLEDFFKESTRAVAIGEIGLDYYRYTSGPLLQKKFFEAQIRLAVRLRKPVIIHNRHASEDITMCLNKIGVENISGQAVFHCCPPEEKLLQYAKENKIYVGVDGDVTYDSNKQDFVKEIPLELLLIETDSPYLTPEPIKSEKKFPNEPQNIIYIAQKISKIKNISFDKLKQVTMKNSLKLFSIKQDETN